MKIRFRYPFKINGARATVGTFSGSNTAKSAFQHFFVTGFAVSKVAGHKAAKAKGIHLNLKQGVFLKGKFFGFLTVNAYKPCFTVKGCLPVAVSNAFNWVGAAGAAFAVKLVNLYFIFKLLPVNAVAGIKSTAPDTGNILGMNGDDK